MPRVDVRRLIEKQIGIGRKSNEVADDWRGWAQQLNAIADQMEQKYGDDEGFAGIDEALEGIRAQAEACEVTAQGIEDMDMGEASAKPAVKTKSDSGTPEFNTEIGDELSAISDKLDGVDSDGQDLVDKAASYFYGLAQEMQS